MKIVASLVSFAYAALAHPCESVTGTGTVVDHSKWNTILAAVVTPNQVKGGIKFSSFDYRKLKSEHETLLNEYANMLENVNTTNMACDEQIAMYINSYNAFTARTMVKKNFPASVRDIDQTIAGATGYLAFTQIEHGGNVAGVQLSLDDIEHCMLRGTTTPVTTIGGKCSVGLNVTPFPNAPDPRIHSAVNCASLSCPDIRGTAYTGAGLEAELNAQTQAWIDNDSKGLLVDTTGNFKVSNIMGNSAWYASDFTQNGKTLIDFLNNYTSPEIASSATSTAFEYNWDINNGTVGMPNNKPNGAMRVVLGLPCILALVALL